MIDFYEMKSIVYRMSGNTCFSCFDSIRKLKSAIVNAIKMGLL